MHRAIVLLVFALGALIPVGCGGGPTESELDLIGLWILPHRETPSVFGFVSAQVIFREEGTFVFAGTNPLSMGAAQQFTLEGTWSRSGDVVTLDTGDETRPWHIRFENAEVHFTDPVTGETFSLFRPGPD